MIRTSLSSDTAAEAAARRWRPGSGWPPCGHRTGRDSWSARCSIPHLADAVRMVQDGYASAADVDTAMTLGCGYPQGPFQLLDAAGPAAVLAGLQAMYDAYGDPAFAPPPLLAEHAAAAIEFRRHRGSGSTLVPAALSSRGNASRRR